MTTWLTVGFTLWLALDAAARPAPEAPPPTPPALPVDAPDAPAPKPGIERVRMRVTLAGQPKSGGGKLVVQTEYDPTGTVQIPIPEVPRLTFRADGPPAEERIGRSIVVTQRYVFSGPKGSYEVPELVATWTGAPGPDGTVAEAAEGRSKPLFFDIDVPPPREEEPSDIVEPDAVVRWPWMAIAAFGGLFLAGIAYAFRPRRGAEIAAAPPLPPDVAALEQWVAVRDDQHLTIDDKAQQVARIFREYTEAVLGYEATARTTHEVLAYLVGLVHLPEGNVPRARRVLRAADRIKFAEARPAADWLQELDSDLRAFIDGTKPATLGASERRSR